MADHGFAAASANYGSIPKRLDTLLDKACPGSAERLLTAAGVPHDVKEYPDAGHSFLNDHDPADVNALVVALSQNSNSRHHEPSATDARRWIVAFFDEHLRRAPGS